MNKVRDRRCPGETSTIFLTIYKKSPKRSKELVNIVNDLQEVFELKKLGDLPICSQGTR